MTVDPLSRLVGCTVARERQFSGQECAPHIGALPNIWKFVISLLLCLELASLQGHAQSLPPEELARVEYEQKIGAQLPLNTVFVDEGGRQVQLRTYFKDRPVILALVYYECPSLCTVVLNGLLESVRDLRTTAGQDFEIVVVSIKPNDAPSLAAKKKQAYVRRYARPDAARGWHFLCGNADSIRLLADTVGFHYAFDPASGQFAHASGCVVLTPRGMVSRYFLGIEYSPKELQASLNNASKEQRGSIASRLLLLCFHYDPNTGRYTPLINRILQGVSLGTVLLLGGMIVCLSRRERPRGGKERRQ